MIGTLFQTADEGIEQAILANRLAASDLVTPVLEGDIEAGKRMNQLNESWWRLEEERRRLAMGLA